MLKDRSIFRPGLFSGTLALLILLTSAGVFAAPSIYQKDDRQVVDERTPLKIRQISQGVCGIGPHRAWESCCTGFRVAEDLVMTNFHCLACLHGRTDHWAQKLRGESLEPLPSPQQWGPEFFDQLPSAEEGSRGPRPAAPALPVTPLVRAFNQSLVDRLNREQRLFEWLDFGKNARGGGADSLSFLKNQGEQQVVIQSIAAFSERFDFLLLKTGPLSDFIPVLTLAHHYPLSPNLPLLNIGLPRRSERPGLKTFDNSRDCILAWVSDPQLEHLGRQGNLRHRCDTNPGSSGSPLIHRSLQLVVGLHWGGGAGHNRHSANLGISMAEILDFIQLEYPEIYPQLSVY